METYECSCCVRGYHVYQHIWSAAVVEVLSCEREPTNSRDRYAVAIKKDEVAIGHLPRKVYGPRFLPPVVASVTARFAMAIAGEGMASESDPLGSGSPSLCLKYRRTARSRIKETGGRDDEVLYRSSVSSQTAGLSRHTKRPSRRRARVGATPPGSATAK